MLLEPCGGRGPPPGMPSVSGAGVELAQWRWLPLEVALAHSGWGWKQLFQLIANDSGRESQTFTGPRAAKSKQ